MSISLPDAIEPRVGGLDRVLRGAHFSRDVVFVDRWLQEEHVEAFLILGERVTCYPANY